MANATGQVALTPSPPVPPPPFFTPPRPALVAQVTGSSAVRTWARIDSLGNVDTSLAITSEAGNNWRAIASLNGTQVS
jgi:hypothetical protein